MDLRRERPGCDKIHQLLKNNGRSRRRRARGPRFREPDADDFELKVLFEVTSDGRAKSDNDGSQRNEQHALG